MSIQNSKDKKSWGSISLPPSWLLIPFFWVNLLFVGAGWGLCVCLFVCVRLVCERGGCVTAVLIPCERSESGWGLFIKKESKMKCERIPLYVYECRVSEILWPEATLLSQLKRMGEKTIQISDFPLLLHLRLLPPSYSLFLCLSSQQGGEARLTNWTKSEWIAEGQRRAWVGAMPVGRCSQQHNTRWRRLSSGVHPSRAKVMGLIRTEVNGRTYLTEEGGREKEGWGRRSSPGWKAQRGGVFLPPIISELMGCRQKSD